MICVHLCSKRFRSDDEGDDRRKKFLERNRAAAARCRQKRKNWIVNLEKKGEELQSTNSKLQVQYTAFDIVQYMYWYTPWT